MTTPGHTLRPVLPIVNEGERFSRLAIEHATGVFSLNDSDLTPADTTDVILLGLIRQRMMWRPDGRIMECRSYDFDHGHPTHEFPWDESNFEKPIGGDVPDIRLSCGACIFSDWVADPLVDSKSRKPRCLEEWIVPLLLSVDGANYSPATLAIKGSAIKPTKEYFDKFQKERKPLYTVTTKIGLHRNVGGRGGFKFSVPHYDRRYEVAEEAWPALSLILRAMRGSITTPIPTRQKTGGMLSVSADQTTVATGYSGSFFS